LLLCPFSRNLFSSVSLSFFQHVGILFAVSSLRLIGMFFSLIIPLLQFPFPCFPHSPLTSPSFRHDDFYSLPPPVFVLAWSPVSRDRFIFRLAHPSSSLAFIFFFPHLLLLPTVSLFLVILYVRFPFCSYALPVYMPACTSPFFVRFFSPSPSSLLFCLLLLLIPLPLTLCCKFRAFCCGPTPYLAFFRLDFRSEPSTCSNFYRAFVPWPMEVMSYSLKSIQFVSTLAPVVEILFWHSYFLSLTLLFPRQL